MSILISTGNIGSGKTLSIVYDFYKLLGKRTIYTNIKCRGLPNVKLINPSMFMNKELINTKKNGEEVFKYSVNKDFWMNRKKEPIDIVIDEAHTIFSSRRTQSKQSQIFTEFLSVVRKVLSSSPDDEGGRLVFITQTLRKIDPNARDLAMIRYHRCYYKKTCLKCSLVWDESSDQHEPLFLCPRCKHHKLKKSNWVVEVYKFPDEEKFYRWKEGGHRTYYDHYFIPTKELIKVFPMFDTLQFDDLFGDF